MKLRKWWRRVSILLSLWLFVNIVGSFVFHIWDPLWTPIEAAAFGYMAWEVVYGHKTL